MLLTMMMLWSVPAQLEVELATSDGTAQVGQLERLDDETVVLVQPGGSHDFPLNTLRQIRFDRSASPAEPAGQEATLSDGSRLTIGGVQSHNAQLVLQSADGATRWQVPRQQVRAIRLMKLDGDQQRTWKELAQSAPQSDMIVVRQRDQRLRPVNGVIAEVGLQSVKFLFEGDTLDVDRQRIAGLVYATPAQPQAGAPLGQLVLKDGSAVQVQRLRTEENELVVATAAGLELRFGLDKLVHLDLAATSTVYLSDMEPESMTVRPFLRVPALAAAHQRWYQPQHNQRISRQPLTATIDGSERSFSKGLGLHSQTVAVYRLAGGFRRFLALAAVDEPQSQNQVELVILVDGREAYRRTIVAGEPPQPIDVDLSGVNRMQIQVGYGTDGDIGDQVSLFDARFIK